VNQGLGGVPYALLIDVSTPDGRLTTSKYEVGDSDSHCFPERQDNPDSPLFTEARPEVRFEYSTNKDGPWQVYGWGYKTNLCGQTHNSNFLVGSFSSAGQTVSDACRGYVRVSATYSVIAALAGGGTKRTHYRAEKIIGCKNVGLEEGDDYPPLTYPIVPLILQEYQPQLEYIAPSLMNDSTNLKKSALKLPAPQ